MKRHFYILVVISLLFACAKNGALNDVRQVLEKARNSEKVKKYSQMKLDDAELAYSKAKGSHHPDDIYVAKRKAEIALFYADAQETQENYLKAKNSYDEKLASQKKEKEEEIARLKDELAEKDRLLQEREEEWAKARSELEDAMKGLGEVKQEDRGLVLYISDILFDFDKSTLKKGAIDGLIKVAEKLGEFPNYKLKVEGHTDSIGSEQYNQKLSDARASTVSEFLIGHGVGADRVTTYGFGESAPRATNDTEAGRQLNRRVEIIVEHNK